MSFKANYDRHPYVEVKNYDGHIYNGYEQIFAGVRKKAEIKLEQADQVTVAIECYPGADESEILEAAINYLKPDNVFRTLDYKKSEAEIFSMIERNLTDDRVFGLMSHFKIEEFFPENAGEKFKEDAGEKKGLNLILGTGSVVLIEPDILVYADMARWEIQQRYRAGLSNWGADNGDEDVLRKYKRAYFVEWRTSDRLKVSLFEKIDYLLDTNVSGKPKMISGDSFLKGLEECAVRPFRVVPLFDPAPWGGQWMKKYCNLDQDKENYGWCFDCIPEENSLYLKFGDTVVEVPSIDVVLRQPIHLLGDKVHARFGAEFPIRFDFLDTIGGGNLSFQVHPLTEYIQDTFGMHYTQDESYYMLDADENATVFLGVKEGVNPEEMIKALEQAQDDPAKPFDAERFTNEFPAKKHDHFLIPAGTCHCSGSGGMVLEISATPYIFTFKLWDWGRLGLDGRPRPVHVNHGKKVIQWHRDTEWVKENLINTVETVAQGEGWEEERTGLHEREFIETRRHWFTDKVVHNTNGGVNVLNLIEGREAIVESPAGKFEPFVVHYAETFIVPAAAGEYIIRPYGEADGQKCGTIKAFVRC